MKKRGFEKIAKYKDCDFPMPARQTKNAAGYDFYLPEDITIAPGEQKLVPTGTKAYMQADEFLGLHIRSSLAVKKGLLLLNNVGIIDSDYYNNPDNEGHIMVALKNMSTSPVTLKKGDRVAQGIFYKFLVTDDDESKSKNDRAGGFGSTK
jgi:dUTP pyrophosphatase